MRSSDLVKAVAERGASYVNACALRLRSSARVRYLPFIEQEFPHLAKRYRATYAFDHKVSDVVQRATSGDDARAVREARRRVRALRPAERSDDGGVVGAIARRWSERAARARSGAVGTVITFMIADPEWARMWTSSCFRFLFGIASSPRCRSDASIAALRALIEQRFPDAAPLTGRRADHRAGGHRNRRARPVLPNGGLPRGRLSVWAPHGGADGHPSRRLPRRRRRRRTRGLDRRRQHRGRRVLGADGPYLVRPTSRLHALRAAEELLRSGGFSLLVLAGAEPQGTETVRLTRAAREGGTALVTVGSSASMASLRLTSRLLRYRWRRTPFGDPAERRGRHRARQRAEPPAGAPTPTFPFRSCIMSYVCLWSPSWPTGADFPADLVASLLDARAARRRRRARSRLGRRARPARQPARRRDAARRRPTTASTTRTPASR